MRLAFDYDGTRYIECLPDKKGEYPDAEIYNHSNDSHFRGHFKQDEGGDIEQEKIEIPVVELKAGTPQWLKLKIEEIQKIVEENFKTFEIVTADHYEMLEDHEARLDALERLSTTKDKAQTELEGKKKPTSKKG